MRALLLTALAFFILASPALAFNLFGTDSSPQGQKDFTGAGTVNVQNWPQKALDICKKSQDNAIQACQDYVKRLNLNPGGWWVTRMVSAQSFIPRDPPIDVNIQDIISGKFDCPPHDLLVDSSGHLVLQTAIHSETVTYGKSTQKTGAKHVPGGDESIQIACSFSCSAWPCAAGTDPYKNCEDTYFNDANGDGISDGQREASGGGWGGRTKKEVVDRIINGEPSAEGGYYYGLKLMCEGEEKTPWWKFWKEKNCKLKDCVTEEIPYKGVAGADVQTGRTIIRVCCGCSCKNNDFLTPSFKNDTYVPLGRDPFVEIFTWKPIEKTLDEDIDKNIKIISTLPRLPAYVNYLLGNDRVSVSVDAGSNKFANFGVVLVDGKVSSAQKGSLPGATMSVSTDYKTYFKIRDSKDPAGDIVKAFNDKSIKYSATGLKGVVKTGLVNLAAGFLGGWQTPTVRPGTPVVINGQTGVVKVNPNNVFIVSYPTTTVMPVVNNYANVYGYSYAMPQKLVSSTPSYYSQNAGIYNYQTSNYANYWGTQSYRPTVPSFGYTATTAMQSAYAGYTYAGRGGFGGVSGATYSTVGFRA